MTLRAGARRYRALLSLPGARGPVIASAAGSLPIGMYGLGILLMAREATGSFADAGQVVGAFGLANAVGAVAQGRLMDRLGQPRVLRAAGLVHVALVIALVAAAERGAAAWALAAIAAAAGWFLPQLPAAMRSLWGALVEDEERRQAAYALGAIVFEVSVVTAPALVAALVALASPAVAVLVAGALCAGGALAFAATEGSQRWRGEVHAVGWLGPLGAGGMRTLFAVMLAFGVAVGLVQVALPAYGAERGSAEIGGLLLAALSAGSLAGGLLYGARRWPGTPALRFGALLAGLGAGFALLAVAEVTAVVIVVLLATGTLLAPIVVVASTLLDTAAPPGTVTEAFTVMVMGIVAGTAVGNALGGAIVDAASYEAAALAAAGASLLGAAYALARRRTLEPGGR